LLAADYADFSTIVGRFCELRKLLELTQTPYNRSFTLG